MAGVTADSFSFKNKYIPKSKKSLQLVRKRKKEMPAPPLYLIDPLELTFSSSFLQRHSIFIHKKVDQSKQLAAMAVAMGATLINSEKEEEDLTFVTDLVICGTDQSVKPRLIHQALEQHIRIVSPLWIVNCYRKKSFQDPYLFPYHMNNTRKTLKLQVQDDNNPFDVADHEPGEDEFEFLAGVSDCEIGSGGARQTIDKSTTPAPALVRPKKPTPTKDIADILNNPSVMELIKKKRKEQMTRKVVGTKRESLRANKHKNIKQPQAQKVSLYAKNGMNLWYGQKD